GKAVVPIVSRNTSFYAPAITGEQAFTEVQLPALESRIRDLGLYPHRMHVDELASVEHDRGKIDALFLQIMKETLERWLRIAEERLRGKGVQIYVMLGNDDEPVLREVLSSSPLVMDPEDLVSQLADPARSIFNLHVPPIRTAIDTAPVVDENLSPVIQGGSILMGSAGSEAVRAVIEKYQPLIALHGHIHESRGTVKIGKTVCINPGSAYGEGVLHGALFELDKRKGLKRYQLTSG
ncbi:MAG TPA: hypothetical protein VF844_23685, partial [Ktedonobacteraceae bacterium]